METRRFVPGPWFLLACLGCLPVSAAPPRLKVVVDAPGVYTIDLGDSAEWESDVESLVLTHRETVLPSPRPLDPLRESFEFVVPTAQFELPERLDGSTSIVLQLAAGSPRAVERAEVLEPTGELAETSRRADASGSDVEGRLPVAEAERSRRFEQDLVRAPLDSVAAEGGVDTSWFWAMISHQASSRLDVEIGDLADRRPGGDWMLGIRLLGWSVPRVASGVDDHQVEVWLDGRRVGEVAWDGRRMVEAEVVVADPGPPPAGGHRLTLAVERRTVDRAGSAEELVDLVYVDRVDVRYPVGAARADAGAPIRLAVSSTPRWLRAAEDSSEAIARTARGDRLAPHPAGGWVVPARSSETRSSEAQSSETRSSETQSSGAAFPAAPVAEGSSRSSEALEVWIVEPEERRSPLAVEPAGAGVQPLPPDLDLLMLAPSELLPGAERLAEHHRRRGLRVALVDVAAVYDAFGWGEKRPDAIRRFLDDTLETTSPDLRYVLLVGDADWLRPVHAVAAGESMPPSRDLIPTVVVPSSYGPAASDHAYAADPTDEASPRFAIGRLPVVTAAELAVVVDKLLAHAAAPADPDAGLLLLSDATPPALRRRTLLAERVAERVAERLTERLSNSESGDSESLIDQPAAGGETPDRTAIEAIDRRPAVVHFGGHGSRFQWQVGASAMAGPSAFFDLDDVALLAPSRRLPVVISASCATAPFDHPTADSLGEAMLTTPDRGAVAFIGTGVRLFTPRAFSLELIEALGTEATVGDALVVAKRATARPHVSRLYNLLGDPATPLR